MTATKTVDVAIIGAGPAGMAAALRVSQAGLSVVVFDEQARVGGQIFRQTPSVFKGGEPSAYRLYPFGKALVEKAEASAKIDWRFRQTVWGLFPEPDGTRVRAAGSTVMARKVLVATGAYEMPVAFPGWTKPGVMGVGAIQTLLKSQHIVPGQTFVLAGSHPLLLLVAALLCKSGAQVREVAFARSRPTFIEMLSGLAAVPGNLSIFRETAHAFASLAKNRVPIRFGRVVVSANGPDDGIRSVTLADCDAQWRVTGGHRDYDVDVLGIGYGLLPSTELCRQAGCSASWRPLDGSWVIDHDGSQRTSVKGIYVAGEPAGIRGAKSAAAEGELAALTIIQDIGRAAELQSEVRSARRRIRSIRRFSDRVATFFAPRLDALAALADDETLICRCEDVEAGEVRRFLRDNAHATNINVVKLACRTGMGFCQGRYCQHTIAQFVAQARDQPIASCGCFSARAPVKPTYLGNMLDGLSEES